MSSLRLDHAVLAVPDLDQAAAEMQARLGFGSVAGGTHPAWGTANRIVPLGSTYLELMAVVDETVAAGSWFGRHVAETAAEREHLLGWVVATDDIEAVGRRLGLDVSSGSRARPDGSTLTWKLAGLERAMKASAFPFFIQWDGPADAHPGATRVEHRCRPRGFEWIQVSANESELREWIGPAQLPLRVADGQASLQSVAIGTANGEIVLGERRR